MTQEIEEIKIPLVMKSGLVHWLTQKTSDNLKAIISKQSAHSFINITEIGITINTAEIDGIYTTKEYDELSKIKQGMWQCALGKWHGKKEICECKKEKFKNDQEAKRRKQEEEMERELTPEEREKIAGKMKDLRAEINRLGIGKRHC